MRPNQAPKVDGSLKELAPGSLLADATRDKEIAQHIDSRERNRREAWVKLRKANGFTIVDCNEYDGLRMSKSVEQKCSSRGDVAALTVELPVGVKERRELFEVLSCCLVYGDHVLVSMLKWLPPRTRLEVWFGYGRMPARAPAELFERRSGESGLL